MFATSPTLKEIISAPFKRSQLGLFHGKMKQYGNNVPHSMHKTRRAWLPNIHNKRFFSDALQQFVRVKVSTRALKTINKVRSLMVPVQLALVLTHSDWYVSTVASTSTSSVHVTNCSGGRG